MSELTDEQLKELARTIWHASRADEGTISAAGADIVAVALAPVVTEMLAEAWDEGFDRAEYMARCWGHVDNWGDGDDPYPTNPYRRVRA